MKPVFPYPTLFGDVDLKVVSVHVDGAALPFQRISVDEQTVALHRSGREVWNAATIRMAAAVPEAELADGPWSDVRCLAVLSEKATNSRIVRPLHRSQGGSWQGEIDLVKARHFGRVSLTVVVTAAVDGVEGRLIGSLDREWFIDIRASVPARQPDVAILQRDFRDGPDEWLRPFKDAPWIVETTGEVPTVYLNTNSVEGLLEVLNEPRTPTERLLSDLTTTQIAQAAWTAMFHTAISDLELDEDGTPTMPTGWRESVLRMMVPDILPGRRLTDALFDIREQRTDGSGWSALQTAIQYAAGRRSKVARNLTTAVRSAHRIEESDTA